MRHWVRFSLSCFLVVVAAGFMAGAVRKKVPAKKEAAAHSGSKLKTPAAGGKKAPTARRRVAARQTVARAATPARQAAPSNERYREIQEALASKGYLATPPTGQWDQNSQDAMRRFQADQKLDSTGKLTSRSIIALGLGSPSAAPSPSPAPKP